MSRLLNSLRDKAADLVEADLPSAEETRHVLAALLLLLGDAGLEGPEPAAPEVVPVDPPPTSEIPVRTYTQAEVEQLLSDAHASHAAEPEPTAPEPAPSLVPDPAPSSEA